ncbi:hypothetical protein [Kordiimonas sp. SCSIO 12610]|uniref:hypothetical protein n=1 Tax=Kordiimonas sp. SCSIO 12610 TaxID=2829597 RepID=UPI00210CA9F5|nr:hypothetical protein [Kordiimonas sp. SCSIO 12610]UTW54934.1 hypothetical protein KFF44_14170 [Kordiimonas sp. SCSIO 12610]
MKVISHYALIYLFMLIFNTIKPVSADFIASTLEPIHIMQKDGSVHDLQAEHAFSKMSLEELKAIDRSSLTKSQRKLHRKALKIARRNAKALRKQQEQYDKKLKKRQRKIRGFIRSASVIAGDKFDQEAQIYGKNISKLNFFTDYSEDVLLRAFVKDIHNIKIQIYIGVGYKSKPEPINLSQNGAPKWRNYYGITLPGGTNLVTYQIDRSVKNCDENICNMSEIIAGNIDFHDLVKLASNFQPLEYKVKTQLANDYVSYLSNEYVIAFLTAIMAELHRADPKFEGSLTFLQGLTDSLGPGIARPTSLD